MSKIQQSQPSEPYRQPNVGKNQKIQRLVTYFRTSGYHSFSRVYMSRPMQDIFTVNLVENNKTRFGRVSNRWPNLGELRRQKKAPHKEVLYLWMPVEADKHVLKSINNCTNDQLQNAIKLVGLRLEDHTISQKDAEMILDMCYAEMQNRL